jgi:O-acetyl-ADP-ribose deacetylase
VDADEGTMLARREVDGATLVAVQGDLTRQRVDVVVNAANERLEHGGGVAAALARAGGEAVQRESRRWVEEHGPVRPGSAAVTSAGALPAARLVHVVGPRFRAGQDNERLLGEAVEAALAAADAHDAVAVALPAISAGIFGYPPAEAAHIIARTCRARLAQGSGTVREIRLVGFDRATAGFFAAALDEAGGP